MSRPTPQRLVEIAAANIYALKHGDEYPTDVAIRDLIIKLNAITAERDAALARVHELEERLDNIKDAAFERDLND
jgi:hypothetical protein